MSTLDDDVTDGVTDLETISEQPEKLKNFEDMCKGEIKAKKKKSKEEIEQIYGTGSERS